MGLRIKETRITPAVVIEKGEISIRGRSIPEDAFEFYNPVLKACQDYISKPAAQTAVSIHLEYINSGSKKYLTNILTILEKSYLDGNDCKINWIYDEDDEAMLDLGRDLKSIIKIPLTVKPSK